MTRVLVFLVVAKLAAVWVLFGGLHAQADSGDTIADRVFGQGGSFTSNTCNLDGRSASTLCWPTRMAVDGAGNVYVPDAGNNRVLEYNSPLTTNTVADVVFGQGGSFTSGACNLNDRSASSLCGPHAVAVDGAGNVYVADELNNRVLEYNSPLTTNTVADLVFGQGGSFISGDANHGSISASSLHSPIAVAVDSVGNLYVADRDNNRVLEYNSPLTTNTVADVVFGQGGSFTSSSCNLGGTISASGMCRPGGVAVDNAGNLYVGDYDNNRVLEYNTPLTADVVADRVFGQGGSFTSGTCNLGGITASSLCDPQTMAVDGAGNLYVGDGDNNRVLEYNAPLTTGTVADLVFGQGGSFTSGTCNLGGITASSLCGPGVAVDGMGNVYANDAPNHRVLEYDAPLSSPSTPVGGIAELPDIAESGSSARNFIAPAGAAMAGAIIVAAGGWYASRRWLRHRA